MLLLESQCVFYETLRPEQFLALRVFVPFGPFWKVDHFGTFDVGIQMVPSLNPSIKWSRGSHFPLCSLRSPARRPIALAAPTPHDVWRRVLQE